MLLNFWATYCIPCREEIPALNALQSELQSQGLKIVGASLDDNVDGVNAYQQEVAKFEYQVLLGGSDAKVKFEQSVLPTTYLIDRQGRIRQKIIGARDKAGWEAAVKPCLRKHLQPRARQLTVSNSRSNTMKKLLILSILALLISPAIAVAQAGHEYSPLVEKTVNYKNWTLPNLKTDQPEDLRKLMAGKKLVMIVYFAPWCGNWRYEAPIAAKFMRNTKTRDFRLSVLASMLHALMFAATLARPAHLIRS